MERTTGVYKVNRHWKAQASGSATLLPERFYRARFCMGARADVVRQYIADHAPWTKPTDFESIESETRLLARGYGDAPEQATMVPIEEDRAREEYLERETED